MRKFKLAVLRKFDGLQENSERQFNKLRNKINEEEYSAKETEILKKNKTKILKMKNPIMR